MDIFWNYTLQILVVTIRTCAMPDIKTSKNHTLDVAQKIYIERYSLSNAAAQDQRKGYKINYCRIFYNYTCKAEGVITKA